MSARYVAGRPVPAKRGTVPAERPKRKPAARRAAVTVAERLLAEADRARARAYAPYSRFPVGAALLGKSGRVYRGCNVENSSFGLSICAERNAIFQAVTEGEKEFKAIAVSARAGEQPSPCGACRQVLHEFGPRMWVMWRGRGGKVVRARVDSLLEHAFRFSKKKKKATGRTR